jgi:pimeloyl-ACP methyl ester carboxylesterase
MSDRPVRIAYIDTRKEHTLLMLHGFPLNSTMWWPQINGLEPAARVIAPDLRGFGLSGTTEAVWNMGLLADDCLRLLDTLEVTEPVVLAGLSMGGYIALELMRRAPERVKGLILTATRAEADSPEGKAGRDKTIAQVEKEGSAELIETMLPKLLSDHSLQHSAALQTALREMMQAASVAGIIGALHALRDRPDSTGTLPGIEVPTLIIHGQDDKLIPVESARLMQARIPDAALELLPNAGHMPNMEQPDRWNTAALHFLEHL